MKIKFLHKITSFWLIIAILLPMSLQFAHSFENHDQGGECKNSSIQHFHNQQIDCEFDHYIFNTAASLNTITLELHQPKLFLSSPIYFTSEGEGIQLFSKSSRAPPYSII